MDQYSEQTQPEEQTPAPTLSISKDARSFWPGTSGWTLFLAITGFLTSALIGFILVFMLSIASKGDRMVYPEGLTTVLIIYFVLFIGILGISILFLLLSNSFGRASRYGHTKDVQRSTGRLLLYFQVAGVFAVLLSIYQFWSLFQMISKF